MHSNNDESVDAPPEQCCDRAMLLLQIIVGFSQDDLNPITAGNAANSLNRA